MADDAILQKSGESDRLESWKEIAAYLGRDVRTVQRWERSEGLPVHRHQHGERGSVFAYRAEIDAWRTARAARPVEADPEKATHASRRLVVFAAAAGVIALAGVATLAWRTFKPRAATPAAAVADAPYDAPRLLDALTREQPAIRTLRVGKSTQYLQLVNDDKDLYVADWNSGLFIVDTATLRVVHTVETRQPYALTKSDDGRFLYVGTAGGDVLIIDTSTRSVRTVRSGIRIRALAIGAGGGTLYIAGAYSGLLAMDVATGVVRTLSGLPCPVGLGRSRDGARLYVTYQCSGPGGRPGHDAVDVLDTATNTSLGAITGLPNVGGEIAVSPDGSQIWLDGSDACHSQYYDRQGCPLTGGGIIHVLRAVDRTPVRSLPFGPRTFNGGTRLTFTPDGRRVAANNIADLQVFNTATLAVTESLRGKFNSSAAISRDGRWMYIATGSDVAIHAVPIARRPAPPIAMSGRWTGDGTPNDTNTIAHAIIEGTVGYAPGQVGQAFRFDGLGSLRVDLPGGLGIHQAPFTLALWLRTDGDPSVPMILADAVSRDGGEGWRLELTAERRLSACFANGELPCSARSFAGSTSVPPRAWHFVALSWDGAVARLYSGARLDGELALPGFVDDDETPLRFGAGAQFVQPFTGRLDEIEIYHRTLTAAEIASRASVRP